MIQSKGHSMVEVFKTRVNQRDPAAGLREALLQEFPLHGISFDLHDCYSILYIEGDRICNAAIIDLPGIRCFNSEPFD